MNSMVRVVVYEKDKSFYNKLINKNIYYKDLIKTHDCYILTININDYKKICKLYKCKLIKYYGINFIINLINVHKYLLISLLLSLIVLFLLSNTIFEIQINTDNNRIIKIIKAGLVENDIDVYKHKKSFDEIEKIKKNILDNNQDSLEWIEIRNKGCKYIIDVTPRVKKEERGFENNASDIIAAKDGKIMFITSNSGTILKDKNDYVKKGDVLISGNILKDDKIIYQVKSEGKVYAEVWYTVKTTIPYNYVEYIKKDKTINRYYLNIFGYELTIIGKYNGKNVMKEKHIIVDKPYLPFKLYKEIIRRYNYKEFHLSEAEAYEEAIKRSDANINKMLRDDEFIMSKKVLKKEVFSSKIIIEVFYKVYENIGTTSNIINKDV